MWIKRNNIALDYAVPYTSILCAHSTWTEWSCQISQAEQGSVWPLFEWVTYREISFAAGNGAVEENFFLF